MTTPTMVKEDQYKYGFFDEEEALFKANKGVNHEIIDMMCDMKNEGASPVGTLA